MNPIESTLRSVLIFFISFLGKVLNFILAKFQIKKRNVETDNNLIPKSVNYHFTRVCNYSCGFCFHTAKTSYMLSLDDVKIGFDMLKKAGMEKINFSGGEPFLPRRGEHLGEMVHYCKKYLGVSVSIISNGSLIRESWLKKYGKFVDILAISCDSFHEETNKLIGRCQGSRNHVQKLYQIRDWCKEYNILFKINTVVNTYNQDENMIEEIKELDPIRWKVFQCLLLEGENVGPEALKNAENFYINEETFNAFLDRHKTVKCLVPESNTKMQNSYLILDEYMRFLDCQNGWKIPSKSILDVGVEEALKFSGFDEEMFKKRGGIYKWSKEPERLSW
ncbi:S-adenosylmethionine-dependent nucleotide dehydratase RSAD2-like [Euwallacea similis]|uniref:S-adenosylmethionine-dependent nucleotide dehydratase RSAD2-like n=1 Tax=Euwallacea similis TaxID=1736056 RepID=UPI00344C54FF